MMKDPYMTQSAELMRRGKMPKKGDLVKGVDILEISVAGGGQDMMGARMGQIRRIRF